MKQSDFDIPRSEWEHLIDEWIFSEEDRKLLKRRLLDGIVVEKLAEEFNYSTQHTYKKIHNAQNVLFRHIK